MKILCKELLLENTLDESKWDLKNLQVNHSKTGS